ICPSSASSATRRQAGSWRRRSTIWTTSSAERWSDCPCSVDGTGGLMQDSTVFIGAVAYDPKVVPIWEGIRDYFRARGVALDFALFSNYERQVEELLRGHVDIAWNTPLAHVRVKRRTEGRSLSLGMRDSDRDFKSKLVVRKDAGIRALRDLAGKTLAVGSRDST